MKMAVTGHDPIAQFVFYAVMACWFIFLLTFAMRSRRHARQAETRETKRNRSALLGLLLQSLGYLAVWFPTWQRKQFSAIAPMPPVAELVLALLTLTIAAGSVWLVNAASRRLGKQWALAARLVEGHNLITDGPYRWIRNPIYAGMLGLLLATGLAISHWMMLAAATPVFVAGTVFRIRGEERLLREAFGTAFDEYTRKVPALIPGIY